MKISASVYGNQGKSLGEIVAELDMFHIDYLHLDCVDDLTVFDDISYIRSLSRTPIDLHIISDEGPKYFEYIKKNGIEQVAFQHENLSEVMIYPSDIKSKVGIAFTSETPIEVFDEYKDQCSFIMLMTTIPGKSGGSFDKSTFERVRHFKARYPNKQIHVDGGVNDEISFILRNLGVNCAISGSFLVGSSDLPNALLRLRSADINQEFKLGDFMMRVNEFSTLSHVDLTFEKILEAIDGSRMGFTVIVDDNLMVKGIVTDGDIRRALMKNINNLERISVDSVINRNPICMSPESSVQSMLDLIRGYSWPILFLPILNNDGRLEGVVSFNNLIRGEL